MMAVGFASLTRGRASQESINGLQAEMFAVSADDLFGDCPSDLQNNR
jgi:hypothetical protein